MTKKTIGACSICGGPVTVPTVWWGVVPPVPSCEECGATAKQHWPTIEMEKSQDEVKISDNTKTPCTWPTCTEPGMPCCGMTSLSGK